MQPIINPRRRVMLLQLIVLILTTLAASFIVVVAFKQSYKQESIDAMQICIDQGYDYISNVYWQDNNQRIVCYECSTGEMDYKISNTTKVICK